MPLLSNEENEQLVLHCRNKLDELFRLAEFNPEGDTDAAYRAFQENQLDNYEKFEINDEEFLNKMLSDLQDKVIEAEKQKLVFKRLKLELKTLTPKFEETAKHAIFVLDYMEAFYSLENNPYSEFLAQLRTSLDEYETWCLRDKVDKFKSIIQECDEVVPLAKLRYLKNTDIFTAQEQQKFLLHDFDSLAKQLTELDNKEGNKLLAKAQSKAQRLETLLNRRESQDIHSKDYKRTSSEIKHNHGCMPFSFGYQTFLRRKSDLSNTYQEIDADIISVCQDLQEYSLQILEFLWSHPLAKNENRIAPAMDW